MNKYKKHLTDEDIQVLKNTMQKYDDIKSPMKLMAQSIVTEQEKAILRLMYFRFTDYEQQKQRADELEKRWEKLKEHFIKGKEQSSGMLSWSRNNAVLELIEKLQEDDNA